MSANKEIIRSVISRCKVASIKATLVRWGRLNSSVLNDQFFKGTKQQIIERILLQTEKSGLNNEIMGDLELAYIQLHSTSKVWKVYELTGNDLHLNLDPRGLRSKVIHSLQLKWRDGHIYGNMSIFAGAVWLRMHLDLSKMKKTPEKITKLYNPNNSLFVVIFPKSPYVVISKAGVRHSRVLAEAITHAMNAERLKDIQLSGRHVPSLADIVLKKDTEPQAHKYRDLEAKENPLCIRQERKRKGRGGTFEDTEEMVDENRVEKRKRQEDLDKKFGCGPQPVLEKLEYRFDMKFHGTPEFQADCQSSIEIKGTSVLEGLCQLAQAGVMKFPLPKHITSITSKARNSFMIEGKKT